MRKLFTLFAATLTFCSVSVMAQQITVAVDNASTFQPTQIVNGDFSTRPYVPLKYNGTWYNTHPASAGWGVNWTEIHPNGVGGGWNTTETQVYDGGLFEWTSSMGTYNTTLNTNGNNSGHGYFLEMNAYNSAVFYQDLATNGHDIIRWSLQHAVRSNGENLANPQSMRVEIGAPQRDGNNDIVAASGVNNDVDAKIIASTKATYIASGYSGYNGYSGDYSGLALALSQNAQWYTVTGVYSIPQGQDVTRFAFIATNTTSPGAGNLLDNITFSTIFGNLSAHQVEGGAVELKGYWGESDANKTMKVVIGSTTHSVNMSSVRGHSFIITVPAATIGSQTAVRVYHQDYEAAALTIHITPAYSVALASGTENASDWSFSPASSKPGQTVAINNNGTRTVENVTVSRNITSTVEINSSNYTTAMTTFNSTARSKLKFTGDNTNTITVTRDEAEIDLNGFTAGTIMTPNNKYGYPLTIKNGTLSGVDGAGGWGDWFSGTLIFENVTMTNTLWSDGHDVIIKSGTYAVVNNYKKGDTPGTVTIYDGKFMTFNNRQSDANTAGATNGTYTIYGGKYHFDPRTITAYTVVIPAGYAVQSNTDSDSGTYPWKVVNTDLTKAVEFEQLHLTQVTADHQWTFTMPPYDVKVEVEYTDFQGHGTETEPYLIPSTEVWNQLCANIHAGKPYTGKYFLQTTDITISQRTATHSEYINSDFFEGIYDGGGHIMNLNIHETQGDNSTIATAAPFGLVRNATFKNMHITGAVSTNNMRPASLVGFSVGNNAIINCWSEVAISSTYNSDIDAGAFVARLGDNAHFDITGCLFTGSITYSSAGGYEGGGFVGWTRQGSTVTLTDCVFAPSSFVFTTKNAYYMFVGGGASHGTISNCYYNDVAAGASLSLTNVAQEKRIHSITGGTGVTVTPAGTPTTYYDVSTIAIYGNNGGLSAGGVLYGKNADVVSMNLSGASNYTATTGTLSGSANPYSLTMANANSVINFVPVATVTVGENITGYPTFAEALNHWVNNSTLTLLANATHNSTITINNTRTLDLNGFGIKRTGTGRVILLNGSGNLTINDSNPSAEHKFTVTNAYGDAGLGVVNDELTSGYQTFHGGYITGGNSVDHGAGIENDATNGVVTINGGVFIGNGTGTTHGGFYWGHTNKTLNMNGGRIIYNTTACQGAAIFIGNATMRLYGGEISHNRSTGNGRAHSGGICSAGTNSFYMHGAPIVTANIGGNSAYNQPNDICLESMIRVDGEMTNTTPIGIMMNLGGFDGTQRGQFSYDSEHIDNSTPSHFVGQNYGDDEPVRIGDALWMWNPVKDTHGTTSYQVTYDSRGGSAVTGQTVLSGEKASQPENPTKAGCTFDAWYRDAQFVEVWDFASEVVNADITLYAHYTNDVILTTLPTAITGLTYTGAAQALVNAGSAIGGTMKYSTDNSTWSESIPTGINPGNYTVYFMVEGDANHADFIPSPNTVEVTIATPSALVIHDNVDNTVLLTSLNDGVARTITIARTLLRNGDYNTICLPFDLSAEQLHAAANPFYGCTVSELTKMWVVGDELRLLMQPVNAMEAGKPYLVKYNGEAANLTELVFDGVTVTVTEGEEKVVDGATMYGILEPTHLAVNNQNYLFLVAGNQLKWPNVDNAMKGFRAYFVIANSDPANHAPVYRGMPARIVEREETATDIESIQPSEVSVQKVIRDGQLIIIRNRVEYNANGQLMNNEQ